MSNSCFASVRLSLLFATEFALAFSSGRGVSAIDL